MLCTRALAKLASNKYTLSVINQLPTISYRHNEITAPIAARFTLVTRFDQCRHCASGTTTTGIVNSTEKVPEKQQGDGILKRVLKKVGLAPNSKARLRVSSNLLYESVADKINYMTFFRDFHLPNTFNSWFLVTELHVWLLLMRSMAEGSESGEDGRFLRNCIVEAMWGDVNTRAKKLGAHNPSQTRHQIETLSEQFQAALIAYDEGIMSDDRVLASALWRRFFEMNCEDYTKIERLVLYVRQTSAILEHMTRDDFIIKPKVPWVDLEKIQIV